MADPLGWIGEAAASGPAFDFGAAFAAEALPASTWPPEPPLWPTFGGGGGGGGDDLALAFALLAELEAGGAMIERTPSASFTGPSSSVLSRARAVAAKLS